MIMKREDIVSAAQILTGMKNAADKIEKASKEKDYEMIISEKKEIIFLSEELKKII